MGSYPPIKGNRDERNATKDETSIPNPSFVVCPITQLDGAVLRRIDANNPTNSSCAQGVVLVAVRRTGST